MTILYYHDRKKELKLSFLLYCIYVLYFGVLKVILQLTFTEVLSSVEAKSMFVYFLHHLMTNIGLNLYLYLLKHMFLVSPLLVSVDPAVQSQLCGDGKSY